MDTQKLVLYCALILFAFTALCFGAGGGSGVSISRRFILIQEQDGDPSKRYPLLKFQNGALQDNTSYFLVLSTGITFNNTQHTPDLHVSATPAANSKTNIIQTVETLHVRGNMYVLGLY